MIDAVVPIDLSRRPLNLLDRISRLIKLARLSDLTIVVGHNDRGTIYDKALSAICKRRSIRLVSDAFYTGEVNNARLRNEAMRVVGAPLTLLLDADLHIQPETLSRVAATVLSGDAPFRILPCLYLSRLGTAKLIHRRVSPDALLRAYLGYRRAPFLHLALPSSVTIFKTADFERAGAFDCAFTGHGYEDLDFLLRLGWLYDLIPRTHEVLADVPTRAPLLTSGFRGYLARLALPAMLHAEVAFHLWHSVRRDAYYGSRSTNAEKFFQKHVAEMSDERQKQRAAQPSLDLALIHSWMDACRTHGVDPRDYSILFDNRPGHVDRFDTPMRKLKLLLNEH
jgi:predicted glycosyltransferase involved in capsule biosynthesis